METITNDDNLQYQLNSKLINIKDLFKFNNFNKSKALDIVGNNFSIDRKKGLVKFKLKDIEFDTFLSGINYKLMDKNKTGKFYSYKHLEKLLTKYEYKNPVYFRKDSKNINPLINIRDIKDFQFLLEISIHESTDCIDSIKKTYIELKSIYNKEISEEEKIYINELSPNFKKYFIKTNIDFGNKQIPIFFSPKRNNIISEILNFIDKNNKQKIYALCGPFGIGKSFTSLLIQKILFYENYPTLYINLSSNGNINDLKNMIIKELFFLIFDKEKYINESKAIFNTIVYNLWEIIILIDEFCDQNKIEYLLILDQYQQLMDEKKQINSLKVKKIFLLSSINDTDVKFNLITHIKKEDIPLFQYNYIISIFQGLEKDILESLKINDDNIINILKLFNYLPVCFFLLEYSYNWKLLDFINHQFIAILKKLSNFFHQSNINIISFLYSKGQLNATDTPTKKSITIKYFLDNINDIPLKYIVYELVEHDGVYLSYAFNYMKYPLECQLNYFNSMILFKSNQNEFLKGGKFEYIIEYKMILDGTLFDIDAFIKVNEIAKMELVDEYKYINIKDIQNKSSIFVFQANYYGKDFDFAILKPQDQVLILLQAKYRISENNIKPKHYYSNKKNNENIIKIINKNFNISITKIYLLYISSWEYNQPEYTFKILKSNKLNCVFYNITEDYFTFNYSNVLNKLEISSSFEIYPKSQNYTEHFYIKSKRIDQMTSSFIKEEQDNFIKSLVQPEVDNTFLKNEYEEFLKYLKTKNISISLIAHIGPFVSEYLKNFLLFPKLYYDYYLLFFSITDNKSIDYSKNIILVYEESYLMNYYNIFSNKNMKSEDFKKKYKNLYYTIGYWKKDKTMNLREE